MLVHSDSFSLERLPSSWLAEVGGEMLSTGCYSNDSKT